MAAQEDGRVGPVTGPRFTLPTLARLALIALCVLGLVAVCWSINALGGTR